MTKPTDPKFAVGAIVRTNQRGINERGFAKGIVIDRYIDRYEQDKTWVYLVKNTIRENNPLKLTKGVGDQESWWERQLEFHGDPFMDDADEYEEILQAQETMEKLNNG